MDWWFYVIIAGGIFTLAVLILIWIIVASNKIVVLKKKIDRNYPLMNSKIKDYNRAVDRILIYVYKNVETNSKVLTNLKNVNKELATVEGVFNKIKAQKAVADLIGGFAGFCKKQEKLKNSKKLKNLFAEIEEIQQSFGEILERYNLAVKEYNIVIARFPTRLVAERFKFEEVKQIVME